MKPSAQSQKSTIPQNLVNEYLQFLTAAFTGFEKLTELNLNTAKALLSDSLTSFRAVADAKSPDELLAAQSNVIKPLAEKSAIYNRTVMEIVTESSSQLTKVTEDQLAEAQATFAQAVNDLLKSAPAGTEQFVEVVKNAVASSQQIASLAQSTAGNKAKPR